MLFIIQGFCVAYTFSVHTPCHHHSQIKNTGVAVFWKVIIKMMKNVPVPRPIHIIAMISRTIEALNIEATYS